MPFTIIRNDITKMPVDAIVNAANTNLAVGGGVCGAIFKEAGAGELSAACAKLAPIKTGEAVITPGFALPAKYIIHTAGPVYRGGGKGEEALLRACYINALELAAKHGCQSIAFPLISGGIYGYPKADALRVATGAIGDFLTDHHMDVALVVLDKEAVAVDAPLLGAVADYIDAHYVREHMEKSFEAHRLLDEAPAVVFSEVTVPGLEDIVGRLDEPFSATLLRLIDKSGKTDAHIYKRANIDRRLFSKIRSNPHYAPSKPTALAFAVALELTLDQTGDLLERAGFALSHSRKLDVIVEYFIGAGRYDIFEINEVLFHYDQALLGG